MFANESLFHYRTGMMVPDAALGEKEDNSAIFVTGILNLMSVGFVPSDELFAALKKTSVAGLERFFKDAMDIIKKSLGADEVLRPMYPGFPKQVAEMSDVEFYINAICHYMTGGQWLPDYPEVNRPALDFNERKVLELCTIDTYHEIFHNLMAANSPLSEGDNHRLVAYLKREKKPFVPEDIPVKETCALVEKVLMDCGKYESVRALVKTPTDILRLAQVACDGDGSLREVKRFGPYKRSMRRFLLSLVNERKGLLEEMNLRKGLWISLGEVLHPGEDKMRQLYPRAAKAFDDLRSNKQVVSFNSRVEAAIAEGDMAKILDLLVTRPGVFARSMDRVLRMAKTPAEQMLVLSKFHSVATDVSSRVLIQLLQFFMNRNTVEVRTFRPAVAANSLYMVDNALEKLDEKVCAKAIQICQSALIAQFTGREYLGAVYIDPVLKGIAMPLNQRSVPDGFRLLPTGSRVQLEPECKVIRPFLHWHNVLDKKGREQRTDIDLSVVFMDESFGEKGCVSYFSRSLRNEGNVVSLHSGDFTNAPISTGGASEFVDINIDMALSAGIRYAVCTINAFTEHSFEDMDVCYGGWMQRVDANAGEVFEPSTVSSKFRLTGERINTPFVIDLVTREVLWLNGNFSVRDTLCIGNSVVRYTPNNVATRYKAIRYFMKSLMGTAYVSMYDILKLHASSRGMLVDVKEDADTVFSMDEGITPFHQDALLMYV